MAKQQAKIELMRKSNEERRLRFLDAPGRTMGINSQALDAQVALNQRKREEAKESDRIDSELLEPATQQISIFTNDLILHHFIDITHLLQTTTYAYPLSTHHRAAQH